MPNRPSAPRLATFTVLASWRSASAPATSPSWMSLATASPVASRRPTQRRHAAAPRRSRSTTAWGAGAPARSSWMRACRPPSSTPAGRRRSVGSRSGGDGPGDLPVAVVDARGMGRVTVVFADDERWSACLATIDADGERDGHRGRANPATPPSSRWVMTRSRSPRSWYSTTWMRRSDRCSSDVSASTPSGRCPGSTTRPMSMARSPAAGTRCGGRATSRRRRSRRSIAGGSAIGAVSPRQ